MVINSIIIFYPDETDLVNVDYQPSAALKRNEQSWPGGSGLQP